MIPHHIPVNKRSFHLFLSGILPILLLAMMIFYVRNQVVADDGNPEWVKREKVGEETAVSPTSPITTNTPSAQFCSTPNLSIPDNNPNGITDTLTITPTGTITDLNVILQIDHTWVGDLVVTLEHVNSGITATLVDRPGMPASQFGCQENNILATLNDEGIDGNVEDTCNTTPPAISGSLVPGDPPNAALLSGFDSQTIDGSWRLYVSDNATSDTGTLVHWCLDYRDAVNNAMPIAVDDDYVAIQDMPLTVAAPGVLANDTDPDGDGITAVLTQPPLTGTLDLQPNGAFTYTPTQNFTGTTTFNYQAFDDVLLSDPALVTITVTIPTSPVIQVTPDSLSSTQRIGIQVTQVLTISNLGTLPLEWEIGTGLPVTYSNGPLVNVPGGGAGGADISLLQNQTLQMSGLGYAHQVATDQRVADEFTITDAEGWLLDEIIFYAYQTDSPINSTITAVNYRIWDGSPADSGSQIIFGNTNINRLVNTSWSGVYRVAESNPSLTNRPIMANIANSGVYLDSGTYWLDWQTDGTLASGPWAPPIAILDQANTGNALKFNNGIWSVITDTGSMAPQGLPFFIEATLSDCTVPDWLQIVPNSSTTEPLSATAADVIFDSTGLTAGLYEAVFCVRSNDPLQPVVRVPVSMTVTNPDISLSKTVGTEPDVCADNDTIYVNTGATIYYCYLVTNNGNITFTLHDLYDSDFGTVLTGHAALLPPGGTITAPINLSTTITTTTINTATWTAYNLDGQDETESVAVATAVLAQPALAITVSAHLDAPNCQPTAPTIIPIGRRAFYCYTATNTGNVPLYTHSLTDSVIGKIFTNTVYTLTPGASINTISMGVTITHRIFTHTLHVATWTAVVNETISAMASGALDITAIQVYYASFPFIIRP